MWIKNNADFLHRPFASCGSIPKRRALARLSIAHRLVNDVRGVPSHAERFPARLQRAFQAPRCGEPHVAQYVFGARVKVFLANPRRLCIQTHRLPPLQSRLTQAPAPERAPAWRASRRINQHRVFFHRRISFCQSCRACVFIERHMQRYHITCFKPKMGYIRNLFFLCAAVSVYLASKTHPAIFATRKPILPVPIMPNFLPSSHAPQGRRFVFHLRTALSQAIRFRFSAISSPNTRSATAAVEYPALLHTVIPFFLHVSISIWSTPVKPRKAALDFLHPLRTVCIQRKVCQYDHVSVLPLATSSSSSVVRVS